MLFMNTISFTLSLGIILLLAPTHPADICGNLVIKLKPVHPTTHKPYSISCMSQPPPGISDELCKNAELELHRSDMTGKKLKVKLSGKTKIIYSPPVIGRQAYNVTCRHKPTNTTAMITVKVAPAPGPIKNFYCTSKTTLICSMDVNMSSKYSNDLYYTLTVNDHRIMCEFKSLDRDRVGCENEHQWRSLKNHKSINITAVAKNEVNSSELTIINIDPMKILVLNSPRNPKVNSVSSDRVNLIFHPPPGDAEFVTKFEIKCNSGGSYRSWTEIEPIKIDTNGYEFILPYANTNYTIRLASQIADALNPDKQWSEYNQINFKTSPARPNLSPDIVPGAFQHLPDHKIRIFWKPLPKFDWGGEIISYKVLKIIENGQVMRKRWEIDHFNSSATVHDLLPKNSYRIFVGCENELGVSTAQSTIEILDVRPDTPKLNRVVLTDGIYHLSWRHSGKIDRFVVFICDARNDQKNCDVLIETLKLNGTEFNHSWSKPIDERRFFGITANLGQASSGIVWFDCITSPNYDMHDSDLQVFSVTSWDSIVLQWKVPCSINSNLKEFNLVYHETSDVGESILKLGEISIPFKHSRDYYNISIINLKPNTQYKIDITMTVISQVGPVKSLYHRTDVIDASPPLNLQVERFDNTSIGLRWDEPTYWNGIPAGYDVEYDGKAEYIKFGEQRATISGLAPFTEYKILIRAVNKNPQGLLLNSNQSTAIMQRTRIGKPGNVSSLRFDVRNSIVDWKSPRDPVSNFFEIYAETENSSQLILLAVLNTTICTLDPHPCDRYNRFSIKIRAVNIDYESQDDTWLFQFPNTTKQLRCLEQFDGNLLGEIEDICTTTSKCYRGDFVFLESKIDCKLRKREWISFWIGVGIVLPALIGGVLLVYLMQRFKRRDDINIEVILPKGLLECDSFD